MKFTKILTASLAFALALGTTFTVDAMAREDMAKIKVGKCGNFKYWEKNSEAKNKLVKYVKNVTKRGSADYIPEDDRIAVFDMDGTLISETTPFYFEWMLYLDRIYNDPSFKPTPELLAHAEIVKKAIAEHAVTDAIDDMETKDKAIILAGLNHKDMRAVVHNTMKQPADGMVNLIRGEAFYLPMAEVVAYLQANKFTVYLVTGAMREIARVHIDGVLHIKPNNVIGADIMTAMTNQGNTPKGKYVYQRDKDEVLRTAEVISANTGVNKVIHIDREIGKQPVLAFGNSSGDYAMFEYTLSKNKYKSMAFSLCCDDVDREYGNLKKAASMKAMCEKKGWVPVSMRNDWKTIYGENVTKVAAPTSK